MRITELERDVVVFQGEAYESVATAFIDGAHALLVDSLASHDEAAEMIDRLRRDYGARVSQTVCTHFGNDHMAGLAIARDAEIVAQRLYRYTFQQRIDRTPDELRAFVAPTRVFDTTLDLRFGRFDLHLFHNPGTTVCSIGVDVPACDLLFTGDNVVSNIAFIGQSSPDLIETSINRLAHVGRSRIVGGHMGPVSATTIAHARHYLQALRRAVVRRRRSADARFAAAIVALPIEECLAPGLVATPFERTWHGHNLTLIRDRNLFMLESLAQAA